MFRLMPYESKSLDLFGAFEREFFSRASQAICKTDVVDKGESFGLEMELPGFDKNDIAIDIKGDYLTVTAKKVAETGTEPGAKYIRRERSVSEYSRSFDISNVNTDTIKADYKNGILFVDLPKKGKEVDAVKSISING